MGLGSGVSGSGMEFWEETALVAAPWWGLHVYNLVFVFKFVCVCVGRSRRHPGCARDDALTSFYVE